MRLSQKIKKLFDPRLPDSIKHHTRRILLSWRFIYRIDVDRIAESIDQEKFAEIHRRYALLDPGDAPEKYLELRKWIDINLRRVRDLELDLGARKRILDLGCGVGYFLYICKWLRHEVLGFDLDESPMFTEMVQLLGVPRVIGRIERYQPLPRFEGKFDLITAHMICFNDHKTDHVWGPAEWEFFLKDAAQYLTPGGRIQLGFNQEFDGLWFTPELRGYLAKRGARIIGPSVTLTADSLARL
ncbi:MAG: class I SAM-dependent methyltransferase [Chthoniobacterales bacterium]